MDFNEVKKALEKADKTQLTAVILEMLEVYPESRAIIFKELEISDDKEEIDYLVAKLRRVYRDLTEHKINELIFFNELTDKFTEANELITKLDEKGDNEAILALVLELIALPLEYKVRALLNHNKEIIDYLFDQFLEMYKESISAIDDSESLIAREKAFHQIVDIVKRPYFKNEPELRWAILMEITPLVEEDGYDNVKKVAQSFLTKEERQLFMTGTTKSVKKIRTKKGSKRKIVQFNSKAAHSTNRYKSVNHFDYVLFMVHLEDKLGHKDEFLKLVRENTQYVFFANITNDILELDGNLARRRQLCRETIDYLEACEDSASIDGSDVNEELYTWLQRLRGIYQEDHNREGYFECKEKLVWLQFGHTFDEFKNELVSEGLWDKKRKQILENIEMKLAPENAAPILARNGEDDLLLKVVKKSPENLIFQYFDRLYEKSPGDINQAFEKEVFHNLTISKSRQKYRELAEEMVEIAKITGDELVDVLFDEIIQKYRGNRPALVEEIQRGKELLANGGLEDKLF
ncbi:MAG TPA: hypothetical protein DIW15_03930 [Bavariicoccus seileri]|uniref:Uncharacterized protein n=1 Tax=Bavariicoccus seileri TaxID=549685 RepID=A0A3D4S4V8_9ENTE|nr:hypothetical protein [Bavariicoccus seileri]HCS93843.1 hypothetical protein [Bavariicoccus seileri]